MNRNEIETNESSRENFDVNFKKGWMPHATLAPLSCLATPRMLQFSDLKFAVRGRLRERVFRTEHAL